MWIHTYLPLIQRLDQSDWLETDGFNDVRHCSFSLLVFCPVHEFPISFFEHWNEILDSLEIRIKNGTRAWWRLARSLCEIIKSRTVNGFSDFQNVYTLLLSAFVLFRVNERIHQMFNVILTMEKGKVSYSSFYSNVSLFE